MPRANRHFLEGYVYHITHRCHDREFLLKHKWIKQRWLYWLAEAKKRFDVSIFNFCLTNNHIHLLASAPSSGDALAQMMHLVAGCTAQEYNRRRDHGGAFWQDRYHATAIDSERHLLNCMVYIDLNMIRAGVVTNPKDWPYGGFHEVMGKKARCRFIDRDRLLRYLSMQDATRMQNMYRDILMEKLAAQSMRQAYWTESLAVGEYAFVQQYEHALAGRAGRREIIKGDEDHYLKEACGEYSAVPALKIHILSGDNAFPLGLAS